MPTQDIVALLGAAVLFLGGVGGFLAQLANSRNAVKRTDADAAAARLKADTEATAARIKSDLDAYRLLSDTHAQQDALEFQNLKSEVARLESALTNRRTEIEDLSGRMRQVRKELDDVRAENATLRVENAKLRVRVAELEKVTAKPGTGPLNLAANTGE